MLTEGNVDSFLNLPKENLEIELRVLEEKTFLCRLEDGPHLICAFEEGFHLLCEIRVEEGRLEGFALGLVLGSDHEVSAGQLKID